MNRYIVIGVLVAFALAAVIFGAGHGSVPYPLDGVKVWLPEYPDMKMTIHSRMTEVSRNWVAESSENVERKGGSNSSSLSSKIELYLLPSRQFLVEEKNGRKLYVMPMSVRWPEAYGGDYEYLGLFSQIGDGSMSYLGGMYLGNYVYIHSIEKKEDGILVTYWNALSADSRKLVSPANRFDEAHQPLPDKATASVMLYWDGDVLHK